MSDTPPQTPRKRVKRGALEEDMKEEAEGEQTTHPYRSIPLKPESIHLTIRNRRYLEIQSFDDSTQIHWLPLDIRQFYTHCLNAKQDNAVPTARWQDLKSLIKYGVKYHKAGVTFHSLIPLQEQLTTEASTATERTTFNLTPYIEIFQDTNHTVSQITLPDTTTVKDFIDNLPIAVE